MGPESFQITTREEEVAKLSACLADCEIDLGSLGAPESGTWTFEVHEPAPHGDPSAFMFSWRPGKWPYRRVRVEIRGVDRYLIDDTEGIETYLLEGATFDRSSREFILQTNLDACVKISGDVTVTIAIDPEVVPSTQPTTPVSGQAIVVWAVVAIGVLLAAAVRVRGLEALALICGMFLALPVAVLALRDWARTLFMRGTILRAIAHLLALPIRVLGLLIVLFFVAGAVGLMYSMVFGQPVGRVVATVALAPQVLLGVLFGRVGIRMMRHPLGAMGAPMWFSGYDAPDEDD